MEKRLRGPYRLVKRVAESISFWVAAFNGLQCAFALSKAFLDARAYAAHVVHVFDFTHLQAAEDAFLRAVVWLWILQWAEAEEPRPVLADADA